MDSIDVLKSENNSLRTAIERMEDELAAANELRAKIRAIEGHLAEREISLRASEAQFAEKVEVRAAEKTRACELSESMAATSLYEVRKENADLKTQLANSQALVENRNRAHLATNRLLVEAKRDIEILVSDVALLERAVRRAKKKTVQHSPARKHAPVRHEAIAVHLL